ncbi:MAG: enoyl-CoA hydratase-related protein [Desulforegulaceae bacterium]|nr:enoyl-CoA hydratase-related protein [Desulforegulaceae bacterium]
MYSEIIFEKKNRTAVITLNRPDKNNVVTGEKIIFELESAVKEINTDKSISVAVLCANGKVFSAGGDLNSMKDKSGMFAGSPHELFENYQENVQRIPKAFYSLEVPSIAAVNGPASGAGCDLAFMCDLRIASEKAWFSQAFINVGLISGDGGLYFLQKISNYPIAAEMVFTGAKISAKRAFSAGMVNKVVSESDVLEEAMKMAEEIAKKPPVTIRLCKKLLKTTQWKNLNDVLDQSALTQSLCHNTLDHFEAVNAFLEKRNPVFKGE